MVTPDTLMTFSMWHFTPEPMLVTISDFVPMQDSASSGKIELR